MAKCEFCLEEVDYTANSSFYGFYCERCLKLVIAESREALADIKSQRSGKSVKKQMSDIPKVSLDELNKAFENLVKGSD